MPSRPRWAVAAATLLAALATAPTTFADSAAQRTFDAHTSAFHAAPKNIPVGDPALPAGAKVLHYKFGPMKIQPGQNFIGIDLQKQRPRVDGWIVGFRPGLVY